MKKLIAGNESESIFATGVMHMLIIGDGEVQLLKSIDGKQSFYPMTDGSGNIVEFSGTDVLFNAEIENTSQNVHYKIKCTEGEVEYKVQLR